MQLHPTRRTTRHRQFNSFVLALLIACTAGLVRGATIETFDDTKITATVTGLEQGELLLQPSGNNMPLKKLPLQDVVQITLTASDRTSAAPAPTPATAPASTAPAVPPATRAATAPATAPATQPAVSSSQPAKPSLWRVSFGAADHLTATLKSWDEKQLTLSAEPLEGAAMVIPLAELREIWTTSDARTKKARDLNVAAQAEDVVFVEKDNQVKAVKGIATGLDADSLKFKYDGQERQIKLERVVGVVLAERERPIEKNLYETLTLTSGDALSGRILSLQDGRFAVALLAAAAGGGGDGAGAPVQAGAAVPLAQVAKIDIRNGRLVCLCDLKPTTVIQTPYFDRLMPYQVDKSLAGGPLVLTDGTVARGIAVHSRCILTYDLAGAFSKLKTKVGFQQPEGRAGRAALRVLGDGKVLWADDDLKGDAKPTPLDLSIEDIKTLTLEVDYGKDQDVADRVIWAYPRLLKGAAR